MKESILWKDIIKRSSYLISLVLVGGLYSVFDRVTGREIELTTFIDKLIPFNKYFIIAYVFWYFYIVALTVYFCIFDEKKYCRVLLSINIGMIICYIIYMIYPTTVPRPVFKGNGTIIDNVLLAIYRDDKPYNCFPSIHVVNTIIVTFYVMKDKLYLNKYIKAACIFCAGAIIYSTWAIKQHVILDAVSAAVVALSLCMVFDRLEFPERVPARVPGVQKIE